MSNALAIAAVTAVLKDLLETRLTEQQITTTLGIQYVVSALPPDLVPLEGDRAAPRLNVFLYQATPNPARTLGGMPTTRVARSAVSNEPLALDLYYLLTAYGIGDLEAEVLLAYGMQLLHEHPVLSRETIRTSLNRLPVSGAGLPPVYQALQGVALAEQMDAVKITPIAMNSEEVAHWWGALQARYRPTAAYQVSVVLIESPLATQEIAEPTAAPQPAMGELAQRVETSATWHDRALPEPQQKLLRQIVSLMRNRRMLYGERDSAKRVTRRMGISVLFAGERGTGTLAAEVLASELQRDLYRIDLSAVVSQYIGETEKNLRRLFDAAEEMGAVLLFDEADALFGKRSEVKDSHDRYANLDVNYLLQQIESFRGLVLLTSNHKSSLDSAILRRLQFVVEFPLQLAETRGREEC